MHTQGGQGILALRGKSVAAYRDHRHLLGGILPSAEGTTGLDLMHELRPEIQEELGLSTSDLITVPLPRGKLHEPNLRPPELVWTGGVRAGRGLTRP